MHVFTNGSRCSNVVGTLCNLEGKSGLLRQNLEILGPNSCTLEKLRRQNSSLCCTLGEHYYSIICPETVLNSTGALVNIQCKNTVFLAVIARNRMRLFGHMAKACTRVFAVAQVNESRIRRIYVM